LSLIGPAYPLEGSTVTCWVGEPAPGFAADQVVFMIAGIPVRLVPLQS
jgi:hypothetical protein